MNSVTEFLAQHPPRVGKLGKWQNEIIELRQAGASLLTICRFLAEQGVTAQSGEVHRFLQRCGRPEMVKRVVRKPPQGVAAQPSAPASLPKFEWEPGKPKTPW